MSTAGADSYSRLRDLIAGIGPANRRRMWEKDLALGLTMPARLQRLAAVEATLAALPDDAWIALKQAVLGQIDRRDPARGWQQAFDLLNEARAYHHLARMGCSEIAFLQAGMQEKSPDLRARCDGRDLYCEVKTLRMAGRESARETFRIKLAKRLQDAARQLAIGSDEPGASRLIYLVLDLGADSPSIAFEIKARVNDDLAAIDLAGISVIVDEI